MKKVGIGCLVIIGVIILLGIIGAAGGNKSSTNTTPSGVTPTPRVATKTTAREIVDAFDENQVAAEQNWGGKYVEFSAKISNITDSGLSFTNVGSKDFSLAQISCKIKDKQQLLTLKNGQTVTVRGVVGKQTIGVIDFSDCEVVQ